MSKSSNGPKHHCRHVPSTAGMCRAHGIAHQAVRSVDELPRALESAWRLNRHSVVEVRSGRNETSM